MVAVGEGTDNGVTRQGHHENPSLPAAGSYGRDSKWYGVSQRPCPSPPILLLLSHCPHRSASLFSVDREP